MHATVEGSQCWPNFDSSSLVDALEFDLTRTDHEEVVVQSTAEKSTSTTSCLSIAHHWMRVVTSGSFPHIDSGSCGEMVNTTQFDMTAGDTDLEDVRSEGAIPEMPMAFGRP